MPGRMRESLLSIRPSPILVDPKAPIEVHSMHHSTTFFAALRPFSLVVGLATCSLGVSLAALDGQAEPLLACLLLIAGVLLQAGANLINDRADLSLPRYSEIERRQIIRNAAIGMLFIAVAVLIGLLFVVIRGLPMFFLGVIGVLGAWSYADGPINFKARGLGVVAVFFLTGVMMVGGVYYALTGSLTWNVVLLSLPFSLYASLLLMANELRDYELDLSEGQRTFSVRFGQHKGVLLYQLLVGLLVICTSSLIVALGLPLLALSLLVLALLARPLAMLKRSVSERAVLAKITGRCYSIFAVVFVSMLWLSPP